MVLVSKAGSSYCIRSDITRGRTRQNVAFGVVNNVEAFIIKENRSIFFSLSCKNARVAQFFPLEIWVSSRCESKEKWRWNRRSIKMVQREVKSFKSSKAKKGGVWRKRANKLRETKV
ncbi:hypothetical protein J1N35_007515 [Gossypium stocksii]|uniref:Uncharacterized protein n=1 Tax=Gossypium stocksii TaxID=47602 RepID=A0A9D3W7P3_9ROSI|nr:hypothetical protein J1N35_007515 [Gossypium stocksii]